MARFDDLITGSVNAPFKRSITAEELEAAIRSPQEHSDWIMHLATMFTDVDPNLIFGFAEIRWIDAEQLRQAYRYVRRETGERRPLFERAVGIEEEG